MSAADGTNITTVPTSELNLLRLKAARWDHCVSRSVFPDFFDGVWEYWCGAADGDPGTAGTTPAEAVDAAIELERGKSPPNVCYPLDAEWDGSHL